MTAPTLITAADWTSVFATDDADCYGTLTVNGVDLWDYRWRHMRLDALFPGNEDLRGGDVPLPGLVPEQGLPRRPQATRIDVPMIVLGKYADAAGTVSPTPNQQLLDNLAYLDANLGIGSQAGDGSVTATWVQPDATVLSADVHVYALRPSAQPGYFARCTLTLNVLGGSFA